MKKSELRKIIKEEIKLSLGQTDIATNAIDILFTADSFHGVDKELSVLAESCQNYLISLGILDKHGNVIFSDYPKQIDNIINKYM